MCAASLGGAGHRREASLKVVLELLDVVRLRRASRTAQGAGCLYLCRLEGRQRHVVGVDRP